MKFLNIKGQSKHFFFLIIAKSFGITQACEPKGVHNKPLKYEERQFGRNIWLWINDFDLNGFCLNKIPHQPVYWKI